MPDRKILKNSIYLLAAQGWEKICAFLIIILIVRYLGKAGYGQYAFAVSFSGIIFMFADFGLGAFLARETAVSRDKTPFLLHQVMFLQSLLCLAGLAIALFMTVVLGYPAVVVASVMLFSTNHFFNVLTSPLRGLFVGTERMGLEATATVIYKTVTLTVVLFALMSGGGILKVLTGPLVASFVTFLFAVTMNTGFLKSSAMEKENRSSWPLILRQAFPFVLVPIIVSMYFYFDSVVLFHMRGPAGVGIFNAAENVLTMVLFISSAMSLAVFPVISRNFAADKKEAASVFRFSFKNLAAIALGLSLGIIFIARPLLVLIYGKEMADAENVLKIMALIIPFMFLINLLASTLCAVGRQIVVARTAGAGLLLNLGLAVCIISGLGVPGAAIATLTTTLILFLIKFSIVSKYLKPEELTSDLLKILPALAVEAVLLWSIKSLSVFVSVPAAAAVYIMVLYACRFFAAGEIQAIKKMLPWETER